MFFSYRFMNGSISSKKLSLNMNLLPVKISNLNLINNSIYNLTNKILNLSFDSSRAIKKLSYFVNGEKIRFKLCAFKQFN